MLPPITVDTYDDYTQSKLNNVKKLIFPADASLYHFDYVLTHFDEMMRRELEQNNKANFDSNFQKFVQWVSEYKRILVESRKNLIDTGSGDALEPYKKILIPPQSGPRILKQYTSINPIFLYTNDIRLQLENAIENGIKYPTGIYEKFNYKIYKNDWLTNNYDINKTYYEIPVLGSVDLGFNNFIHDVLTNVNQSWNFYETNRPIQKPDVKSNDVNIANKISRTMNYALSDINNQIKNSNYKNRYNIVEKVTNDNISYLKQLVSLSNTSANIVENIPDIEEYYEKLLFNNSDVDTSLKIPTDTDDIINVNEIEKIQTVKNTKYEEIGESAIENTFNMPSSSNQQQSNATTLNNLYEDITNISTIDNPNKQTLNIAMTKIYKKNGVNTAEYLSPSNLKAQNQKELSDQNMYLKSISKGAESRLSRYKNAYPLSKVSRGGFGSKQQNSKQQNSKQQNSTQKISISHSGGHQINIEELVGGVGTSNELINELIKNSKRSKNTIDDSKKVLNKIIQDHKTQDIMIFDNEEYLDVGNLQQRNEFLIEMMNIVILHYFLIGEKAEKQEDFFNEMKIKIADFKTTLTNIWTILKSRIPISNFDTDLLAKKTAQGLITQDQITNLLVSNGLNPIIKNAGIDEIADRAYTVNIVDSLIEKHGLKNMGIIANDLEKIMSINTVTNIDKGVAMEDLHKGLFEYYKNIESLNKSLLHEYQSIDATAYNMDTVKNLIGKIIEANIITVIEYTNQIIIRLRNTDINIDVLQLVRKEKSKSKNRIGKFDSYMKDINYELSSKKLIDPKLDISHIEHIDHSKFMVFVLSMHKKYINQYVEPLALVSSTIIPYYSYQKDINNTTKNMYIYSKTHYELWVINTSIFHEGANKMLNVPTASTIDDFNSLLGLIQRFLNYVSETYLYILPSVRDRINIPAYLDAIMDSFFYVNYDILKSSLTFFEFDNDKLNPNNYTTRTEQYQLFENIVEEYLRYLRQMVKYAVNNTDIQTTIDTIIKLRNEFIVNNNDTNLKNLHDSLSIIKNYDVKLDDISDDINKYLFNLYVQLGGSEIFYNVKNIDNTDDTFGKMTNIIISNINTATNSIFNLWNEKMSEFYELSESLILTNNKRNNYFSIINKDQNDINKLRKISKTYNLGGPYSELDYVNEIILPQYAGNDIDPEILTSFKFKQLYGKDIWDEWNNKKLEYVSSESRQNFISIKSAYDKFMSSSIPILNYMKSLVVVNDKVIHDTDITYIAQDVLNYNDKMFINPFDFTSNGEKIYFLYGVDKKIGDIIAGVDIDGELQLYVSNYIDDKIIITPDRDIKFPYIFAIDFSKNYIKLKNVQIPAINIVKNTPVALADIITLQKVINTGKYLIEYIDELYLLVVPENIANSIAALNVENYMTWDKLSTINSPSYSLRKWKKGILLGALTVLDKIENSIIKNSSNTYGTEMALLPLGTIENAINMVNRAKLSDSDFNNTIDKIWIFTRLLVSAWYSLFTHILTRLVLNGYVINIRDFIQKIMKPYLNKNDNTTLLNSLTPLVDRIPEHYKRVSDELEKKLTIINHDRSKYNNADELVINDKILETIEFDSFYTNRGSKSQIIYVIMVISKSSDFENVKNIFVQIENDSEKIINLINFANEYTSNTKMKNFVTYNTTDGRRQDNKELKTLVSGFIVDIRDHVVVNIESIGYSGTSINNNFNILLSSILTIIDGKLSKENDVTDQTIKDRYNSNPQSYQYHTANPVGRDKFKKEYEYAINQYIRNKNNIPIINLIYADAKYIIFSSIIDIFQLSFTNISTNIDQIEIQDIYFLKDIIKKYCKKQMTNIQKTYDDALDIETIFLPVVKNDNRDKIKFLIVSTYNGISINDNNTIDEINNYVNDILSAVKNNLHTYYSMEKENYDNLINMEYDLLEQITNSKSSMIEQVEKLQSIILVTNQVMYNEHYKKSAFVDNVKLTEYVGLSVNTFQMIIEMMTAKIRNMMKLNNDRILANAQINNYIAFLNTIKSRLYLPNSTGTGNVEHVVVSLIYRQMSFGIAEYYYDVLYSIIECLESKPYDDMSNIESYLYSTHYIQLKRSYLLFRWLRYVYLPYKQAQDDISKQSGIKITPILRKKIIIDQTLHDVLSVFIEFHGLRRYLDEYSSTLMDKVQLHLRINDFVTKNDEVNKSLKNLQAKTGKSTEFMMEYNPESEKYMDKWKNGDLLFYNKRNYNALSVNFDLLENIYYYDDVSKTNPLFDLRYKDVYDQVKTNNQGINFNRIYNTNLYPDTDVISNYMSIAPNIRNNKGTVIMTYGYSGVGKSASLFGRQDPATNGILQATLQQFPKDIDIYLRVYEIYGTGAPYNYYWNPEDDLGKIACYPNYYQAIIHHVIDENSDPSLLKDVDRLAFTNRHDMLAYIMNLKNPAVPNVNVMNINDKNLGGDRDYSHYFNGNDMRKSTYVKITTEQYKNFSTFIGGKNGSSIDDLRAKGLKLYNVLPHIIRQIKGTINNSESSRSIVVYDFQICLDKSNPIYVPFLIYDLPGKEDINKTYVQVDEKMVNPDDSEVLKRVFRDIPYDSTAKERKSTYVLNPLLISIFDHNIFYIKYICERLFTGYKVDDTSDRYRINISLAKKIFDDIMNYDVENFAFDPNIDTTKEDGNYIDKGTKYKIKTLYDTNDDGSLKATNLNNLFDEKMLKKNYTDSKYLSNKSNLEKIFMDLSFEKGILETYFDVYYDLNKKFKSNKKDKETIGEKIASSIFRVVGVVFIAHLIKYKLFDIIIEIINLCANNNTTGSNDNSNGGWSRDKIYAFYEAYYINENVVGLLEYLITTILNKSSTIESQDDMELYPRINDIIDKNYKTANRYRALNSLSQNQPNELLDEDYGLYVTGKLLKSTNEIDQLEIDDFIKNNKISTSASNYGEFIVRKKDLNYVVYDRMKKIISFENKGKYDSNKIYRKGETECTENTINIINNPLHYIDPKTAPLDKMVEKNRPLLQDFIEPYQQKISFYYVFYVVSNTNLKIKAEEQVKLLNNSMPFINKMNLGSKKKKVCAT